MQRIFWGLVLLCAVLTFLANAQNSKPKKVKMTAELAVQMVSEQQGTDPILGLWNGAAGGYQWQTAIVRDPNQQESGCKFIGVLIRPWPFFRKGETHICINDTGTPGVYQGREKWKSTFLFGEWHGATFFLRGQNELKQSNNIGFETPLGSDWTLWRQQLPTARPSLTSQGPPLRQTPGGQQGAVVAPTGAGTIESDIFGWFDEEPPQPGTPVLEVVVTARAYEAVLSILREVRGTNTKVSPAWENNILESNYHPPTYRLGEWISRQESPEKLSSVFYWEDEVLGETTPVMNFYMTKHAYASVIAIVQQHFEQIQHTQNMPEPKKRRLGGFLNVLGLVAQGALQGMANYYTVIKPIEDARIAAINAQASQKYAMQQQLWELQKLNQTLDQMRTQAFLNQLQREGEQYNRMLRRYTSGSW